MNEQELRIPAPYDKYYQLGTNDITKEDIPDSFNSYAELEVVGQAFAKDEYEYALADSGLDFLWLVKDETRKLKLVSSVSTRIYPVSIEEIEDCVTAEDCQLQEADTREPSSVDYGNFIVKYMQEFTQMLQDYKIRRVARRRSTEYSGTINGYKFFFVEGTPDFGKHYAKDLYINDKEVDLYQSKKGLGYLHEMNYFSIRDLIKLLESNDFSGIVYKDELDDYEESLTESTEMSDAQRLALQELDACLEVGELDSEKHALAYQIQWDINFEDVPLFINGVDVDLKDIKHVEYGNCNSDYDGCYNVTLHDSTTKHYGWHDWDATASLTRIDCNESFTESEDGWDKPFTWTQVYKKNGFMISDNYNGTFRLEQTSPRTKFIGNFRSVEEAKSAGDDEIAKRDKVNKDKPVQFGVHSFTTDSIIFRGTEEECAEYINKNHLENEAEIYTITANDRHYLEESANKKFNNGDRVYVTVSNRQGTVTKMVSNDVVEVEFEANGTYPARIDRFYTDEVELIDMNPDFDEDVNEQYYAVFAKDTATGKEYCAGVYGSERDAYYWAGMDRDSDIQYHYGNFNYRVERVSDYTDDLDKSKRELDTLKLFNHSTYKENDIDDDF